MPPSPSDPRRQLPAIDRLLAEPRLQPLERVYGRERLLVQARAELAALRERLGKSGLDEGGDDGSAANSELERELAALPERIAALEAEQKTLVARLADPALYQSESQDAPRFSKRLTEIDDELLTLLERWEALEGSAAD